MRLSLRGATALAAAALLGCGKDEGEEPIRCTAEVDCPPGQSCQADSTCTAIRFGLQCTADPACGTGGRCSEGVCTRDCTATSACPVDWNCRPVEGGAVCKAATYPTGAGTFGTACVTDGAVCDAARGYRCYRRTEYDAEAYCSRECGGDGDCPSGYSCLNVGCGTDAWNWCQRTETTWPPQFQKACIRNRWCLRCNFDDECPRPDGVCVADSRGAKYCSKTCSGPGTCPPEATCEDRGDGTRVCKHRYGACVGDRSFCSPCLSHQDCAPDALCYTAQNTGERLCTRSCSRPGDCPGSYLCIQFQDPPPGLGAQCLPLTDLEQRDPPSCY